MLPLKWLLTSNEEVRLLYRNFFFRASSHCSSRICNPAIKTENSSIPSRHQKFPQIININDRRSILQIKTRTRPLIILWLFDQPPMWLAWIVMNIIQLLFKKALGKYLPRIITILPNLILPFRACFTCRFNIREQFPKVFSSIMPDDLFRCVLLEVTHHIRQIVGWQELNNQMDEICLVDAQYFNNPEFIKLNNQFKAIEALLSK